jgi:hypothetical protein
MSTEDNKKSDAQRERGGPPLTNPQDEVCLWKIE